MSAVRLSSEAKARSRRGAHAAIPGRRCIASGEVRSKQDLLRFVIGPGGEVVPDLAGTLPGRGLWLSPRRDMLEKACASNLFARAAKVEVRVPEDLPCRVERSLRRHCLDLIGLARRAGQVVAGYEKVRAWLSAGKVGLLLEASDGAPDGRRKIAAVARAANPDLPVVEIFAAGEIGRALGRERAVHAALARGRFGERLLAESTRLASFVAGGDGPLPEGSDVT